MDQGGILEHTSWLPIILEHTSWLPIPYWMLPEINIELGFLQEKDKWKVAPKIGEYLNSIRQSTMIIFTDGSRDPVSGRAGFGVYVEQLGLEISISRRISNGSSVLTAELMAILWALWWIEEVKPREVIICSDSVGALDNLKVGKSKSRPDIVNDILNVVFSTRFICNISFCLNVVFSTRFICNISFCWVPGHAGVSGNERVDNIAKESLGREVDVHLLLGRVELREKIKESLIKEWQRGWEKEIRGRHYFSIQPEVRKRCSCNFLSRRDSVKMCRLRLGHCGLNYSLHIVGKHVSGLCECGSLETVGHVFLECCLFFVWTQ